MGRAGEFQCTNRLPVGRRRCDERWHITDRPKPIRGAGSAGRLTSFGIGPIRRGYVSTAHGAAQRRRYGESRMALRRVPEAELVVPALQLLCEAPNGELSTTLLIQRLLEYFTPEGDDAEILKNRNDTKFTQKVRNLKSHKTLEKAGLAEPIEDGFRITAAGRELVRSLS